MKIVSTTVFMAKTLILGLKYVYFASLVINMFIFLEMG
jgi:hypothetical protein